MRARAGVPAHVAAPRAAPPPFRRRVAFEELESRLLMSADLNPLASDSLLAAPAPNGAEFRTISAAAPSVVITTDTAAVRRTAEIAFVDTATPEYARLVDGMRESALAAGRDLEVVLIDRDQDGLRTITETLARKTGLDAVHIVSHGEAGSVQLGHARLDFVALAAHATQIKGWGEALGANADLLIYGCHVAATAEGRSLVDALARLTGADVAASDDFTGASSLGGDWALEYNAGTVEARAAAGDSTAWQGVLAVVPDGGEVMVNTTTADTQAEAAVARAGDGSYVVAWASNNQDGNAYGVYARRYDAAGVAQGAEFRVNTYTSNDQRAPAIAMDGSGNFVVVWQSENQDGSNTGIYGRRYDAAGVALGAEFRINTYVTSEQSRPAVAMNAAGAFVVLWESNGQDGGNLGVYGQRFNAAGIAQGTEFRVNNVTVDRQEAPAVAMDDAGNFVAAWQSKDQDGDGFGIYARRYDALGVAQGTEFRINNTTSRDQSAPAVAIDPNDGNFVVAWASNEQDGDKWGVYARRYTAAGVAQGNEFLVNVYTTKDQEAPAIAMAQNGTFAVVWQSEKQLPDDDKFGIFARTFAANGTPQGGEFRVNTYINNDQLAPAIAIDRSGAGNLVVVWSGDGSTDGQGVFAQRYSAPNATPTGLPTISGTATEDQTLTANTAAIADADGLGAFAYQWARSTDGGLSWIPIAAATGTTYTLGDADVGALIRVGVSYTDGGGTAESLTSGAVGPIAGVNDAPVHSVPGAQSTAEDTALVFAGALAFSIADADLGAGLAQVSLTGTNGALTLSGIAGLSFSVGDGTADATMTFTGTIAAVNSALAGMSFLPTPNFTGAAGITITTSDQGGSGSGGARSDTDSVTINVTPVNDAPVHSVPGAQSTAEDTALVFAGALAFSIADADLGAGLAQVSLTGTNGALTLSGIAGLSFSVGDGTADATMTFTGTIAAVNSALAGMSFLPTPNFTGAAGITITTSDQGGSGSGGARSDTDSVTINVTPVNDAPVHSVPGAQSTAEDTALVFAGALAFSIADADLGAGLAQVSLTGTNGALTLSGIAGLSFSVGDGTADATMTFTGTIAAVNSALAGMSFLPTPNFTGAAGITITTSDQGGSGSGGARSDTDSVTINVTPVNDAPVANNASASGNEDDAQIAITLTGSDVEGAIASFRLVGLPGNGVLYSDAGLTLLAAVATDYAATGNARTFYFVPTANWNGTSSFQFTAVDGSGLADATPAIATITVAAVNDAPAGTDGAVATLMNTPRVLTAADFGFTDPDAGDSMSAVRIDSLPLLGTLSIGGIPLLLPGAVVSAAQLAAGDFVFIPLLLTSGTPYASFDFSVADAASVFDPTRNVLTINVLFVNSAPAGSDTVITTDEDVAHLFTVADFGFSDADAGDSLSAVRMDTLPAAGTLTLNAVALSAGQVVLVADINAGLLRFTPAPNASGAGYASFTFSVRDTGGSAFDPAPNTMTINVTPVNDAPAANDVSASGNEDDAQIAITLTGTDLEGPVTSFRITGALPGNGVLYTDAGLTTLAASGIDYAAAGNALTLYFVPAGNWNGVSTFQYTAVDAGGLPDATPANATINVLPVNDAPVANTANASGNEDDAQIAITLAGSDVEGPVASFRLAGLPANGLLYIDPGLTTLAAVATDYAAAANARTFYFVPSANWNGATAFQYTAVDGGGLTDATPANATINVAAVNDAPVNSVPGPQSVNEDSPLALNTIGVSDSENNVTSVVLSVLNGTLAATAAGGAAVAGGGTASVTISGPQAGINLTLASLVYQGNLNFSGTDTLTMTSTDAGTLQDTDWVTISVTPVNNAPAGTNSTVTTDEDVAHLFTVADFGFSDADAGDSLSAVRMDTLPAAGTLTLNAVALSAGQVVLVADINAGLLRFTPAPNASGAGYASFTFSVRDTGGSAFDPAPNTMTINVTPVNDAPAANDVSASGNEDDAQIAITLTGTDLEGPVTSFRITGALPGNGVLYTDAGLTTLAASGIDYAAAGNALTLYFVPAGNWNGVSTFQYTAVDAGGLPDATPANATINVLPLNDAPVAADNAYAVSEDATLAVPLASDGVLANDTDVDGPALSAVLVAGPANGVLALAANGTFTYTPNANFYGLDTFTYRAFDGSANSNVATVTITVNNVADHTLVVDTAADLVNGDTTSIDALLANKGVDGLVSLREAILAANATANAGTPDLIHFSIAGSGPHTIALAATLPQITDAVVIDGTTEPDFAGTPVIVLDGNGGAGNGLRLASNGSTVRGLAIVDFGQVGIVVNGTGNTIEGNYIGIAADGATAAGNQTYGVRVNAGGNVIGGTTAAQRNVISGNRIDGVYVAAGSGNVVQGNYVGTNAAGTAGVANLEDGIWIDGASNTTVGGTAAGQGNLVSGNLWSGIALSGSGTGNVVMGNRIGLDAAGTGAIANQRHGVDLGSFSGAKVGGTVAGAANVIAFNGLEGVSVAAGTGHSILGNSIFANGGLGIDLAPGANSDMNFPVIYSVTVSGGTVTIAGEARPGATVEFFEADADPSGRGEGRTLLGSGVVTGTVAGAVDPTARRFSFTFAAGSMVVGDRLTATATDDGGSTSEFALNVVASALPPGISITPIGGLVTTEDGGTAQFSVVLQSQPGANVTIAFSTSDATEGTVAPASLTFTALNWSVAQIVTVTGIADFLTDGTVAYTLLVAAATSPDPGYNGLDPADIALTNVDGVNDAPTATIGPASYAATEQTFLTLSGTGLSVADVDAGFGSVTVQLSVISGVLTTSAGSTGVTVTSGNGTALLTLTGTVAQLNELFAGNGGATLTYLTSSDSPPASDTLTLSINDNGNSGTGGPLTGSDFATIAITAVNDVPVGTDTTVTTTEDVAHVVTVADFGFSDPDAGDSLTAVRIDTLPSAGTLTLNAVALSAGQVILVADINAGLLRFAPAPDASGAGYASFSFSVRDSGGPAFDPAPNTMTINVTPVNDAPAANDVSASGNEDDAQIAITLTGSDVEGPVASFRLAGLPANGLLYLDAGLTTLASVATDYAATGNARTLYFVPTANWNGATGFQFTAVDGGGLADPTPANATITVAAVNDAPVANDVSASGNEDDAQIAITLTGSDVEGAVASFRLAGLPANGLLYLDAGLTTLAAVATDYVAAADAVTLYFVPVANWNGVTTFQFTATDAGGLSDGSPATATITLTPVNDAPAAADVSASGNEDDAQIAITLTGADVEGPLASFRITGALPGNGLLYTDAGLTTLAASGIDYAAAGNALTLYFVPAANWSGVTTFQYTAVDAGGLSDASPATATINVLPLNDAPVANTASASGNEDDAQIAITLTGSDVEGPVASFRLVGLPANGLLYIDPGLTTLAGVATDYAAAGNALTLYFVPAGNWNGVSTFQFRAVDAGGLPDPIPATATINVTPVNDAPAASDVVANGTEDDAQIAIILIGTDLEGLLSSFRITGALPANGLLYTDPGLTTLAASGIDYAAAGNVLTLYFVPAANWNGVTTFQFAAVDGSGLPDPTPANATITVAAVNDAPVANDVSASGNEDDAQIAITLTGSDVEGAVASFRLAGLPANGLLYLDAGLTTLASVATDYAATGNARTLYFVPTANWNGATGFQFTAVDGAGLADATPANATINVTPLNDAPAGTDATVTTNEDAAHVFTAAHFGFTDADAGDSLSAVRINTLPAAGTLTLNTVALGPAQVILVADINAGLLRFAPAPDANGAGYATLTFSVRDQAGAFDPAPKTLTIDVTPTNDPPTITSNGGGATAAVTIAENTTAITTVTATDIDSAPAGFVYSIAGGADAASFAIDPATGVLRFAVAPNFEAPADAGADNVYDVTVSIDDGNGGSDTQAIAITVTNVNDAPVAVDDTYVTIEDTPLAIAAAGVLANDSDEDGTALVATLVAGPANGTVTLNADGTFTYTPGVNFTGTDSFRYRVIDGALVSGVATVTIAVNPANVAPTAADGNVSSTAGQSYVFTIADFNYTDQDGDPLAYVTITALPAAGVLELNGVPVAANQDVSAADIAAGRFRYVAPASGVSVTTFDFRAHDGIQYAAASNTITIGVVATPASPPPPADGGGGDPAGPPAAAPSPGTATTDASGPGTAPDADAPPSGGGRSGGSGGGDGGGDGAQQMQAAAADGGAASAAAAGVSAPAVAIAGLSSSSAAEGLTLGSREGGLDGLKVSDGSAHELAVKAEAKAIEAIAAPEFLGQLDKLREEQAQESALEVRVAGSVMVVSSGLSVGYVLWLLRGGVLLSSLLSSLPAWRLIDPLPVLGQMGGRADDEDDESLEEMVENTDADAPQGEPAPAPGRR